MIRVRITHAQATTLMAGGTVTVVMYDGAEKVQISVIPVDLVDIDEDVSNHCMWNHAAHLDGRLCMYHARRGEWVTRGPDGAFWQCTRDHVVTEDQLLKVRSPLYIP
jgi:hypothetical protein